MRYSLSVLCVIVIQATFCYGGARIHPLSDEFINSINAKNTTWKAGRNFDVTTPVSRLKILGGGLPRTGSKSQSPLKLHSENVDIPESFDARETWPDCASIIGDVADQGNCGSGWAIAAAGAMSDRICIFSNATVKVSVSAEDILDCCEQCGAGCIGGYPDLAWIWWLHGIVTGGKYGSTGWCKAYSIEPCDHRVDGPYDLCDDLNRVPTPSCKKTCDSGSDREYSSDMTKGSMYYVDRTATQIQIEIMTNGPVEASYKLYEDFFSYKSGVYQHVTGEYVTNHEAKIIGWGVEDDTPYWLAVNTWNEYWGDNGFFKILRGQDECEIETSEVYGGIPQL